MTFYCAADNGSPAGLPHCAHTLRSPHHVAHTRVRVAHSCVVLSLVLPTPGAAHHRRCTPPALPTTGAAHPRRCPPMPLPTPAAAHPRRCPRLKLSTPGAAHPRRCATPGAASPLCCHHLRCSFPAVLKPCATSPRLCPPRRCVVPTPVSPPPADSPSSVGVLTGCVVRRCQACPRCMDAVATRGSLTCPSGCP